MNYKETTRNVLLNYYKKYGVDTTLEVARRALCSKKCNANVKMITSLHGELCETVLEILLQDYKNKRPFAKDWIIAKGLILKDIEKEHSNFLTELDLTLFTGSTIYLFECKSYSGRNQLIDEGTLLRENGESFDVFRQNLLHKETLLKQIEVFKKSRKAAVKMILFDFSTGNTEDLRSPSAKKNLIYAKANDVLSVLQTDQDYWDLVELKRVVTVLANASQSLRPAHLKYVQELHTH